MAKKKEMIDKYAYIEINKRMKFLGFLAFIGITFGIGVVIFEQIFLGFPWVVSVPPIFLIGASALMVPVAERWVYRPWQKTAQRNEATKIDRIYKY